MSDISDRYFESHITVDSKDDSEWQRFTSIMPDVFRASKFDEDNVDHYHGKWFMSCRDTSLSGIKSSIKQAIDTLHGMSYNVVRWKIEDTILDSKYGDSL